MESSRENHIIGLNVPPLYSRCLYPQPKRRFITDWWLGLSERFWSDQWVAVPLHRVANQWVAWRSRFHSNQFKTTFYSPALMECLLCFSTLNCAWTCSSSASCKDDLMTYPVYINPLWFLPRDSIALSPDNQVSEGGDNAMDERATGPLTTVYCPWCSLIYTLVQYILCKSMIRSTCCEKI
jgi:hypothetical protein